MSGVEDTGTPGTQQDEKKPLDGAGGQHINLKVKGQVSTSLHVKCEVSLFQDLVRRCFADFVRLGCCRWGFMFIPEAGFLSRMLRLSFCGNGIGCDTLLLLVWFRLE
jgi:hypothetical protein